MRIAQIAPLIESVPPPLYGGTERVVSYLTEELVRLGHDVTLFASGDSVTSAKLVACCSQGLRLHPTVRDPLPHYMIMLDLVRRMAHDFDVLHFHIDCLHFPLFHHSGIATVTTLHGRQDLPDLQHLYRAFPDMPLVSISEAQRAPIANVNFAGTVLHGLPLERHRPTLEPHGRYLAFLGRASPEKGLDRAIELAQAVGRPIRIAAKVDRVDEAYFRERIVPLLKLPQVEFIGEINERTKTEFLGQAAALLFPIDWPEPFGIAMIEAMACGTPVLAFRKGSVPEVVDDGVTGIIADGFEEAVKSMDRLLALDRAVVRRRFEQRFSAERMAREYLAIYKRLAAKAGTYEAEEEPLALGCAPEAVN